MVSEVKLCLHDEPYSKEEISKLLQISELELETKHLSENTKDINQFYLKQRALHVFQGKEASAPW